MEPFRDHRPGENGPSGAEWEKRYTRGYHSRSSCQRPPRFAEPRGEEQRGCLTGPPSLVQFKNIYIRELADSGLSQTDRDSVRALLITGGHDHEASFYTLFNGHKDLARVP